MSEIHDFVQLPAEGQVTPTNYVTPGTLTTVNSPQYIGVTLTSALATAAGPFISASYSFSTQDNATPVQYLSNYPWLTTVASSYSAAGSRLAP
jgi:hypothetical protein